MILICIFRQVRCILSRCTKFITQLSLIFIPWMLCLFLKKPFTAFLIQILPLIIVIQKRKQAYFFSHFIREIISMLANKTIISHITRIRCMIEIINMSLYCSSNRRTIGGCSGGYSNSEDST